MTVCVPSGLTWRPPNQSAHQVIEDAVNADLVAGGPRRAAHACSSPGLAAVARPALRGNCVGGGAGQARRRGPRPPPGSAASLPGTGCVCTSPGKTSFTAAGRGAEQLPGAGGAGRGAVRPENSHCYSFGRSVSCFFSPGTLRTAPWPGRHPNVPVRVEYSGEGYRARQCRPGAAAMQCRAAGGRAGTAVIVCPAAGCRAAGTAVAAALACRSPGASRQPAGGRRRDGSRPARAPARRHRGAPCRHGSFHPQAHHRVTPSQGPRS